MATVELHSQGPFSFFPDEADPYLFDSPIADHGGIYLWTGPTAAGMKVAYLGKARGSTVSSTFRGRVKCEFKGELSSKHQQLLDLDLWRNGHRRVIANFGGYDSVAHEASLMRF